MIILFVNIILRRFDHPNIVKLEALITSRLSCIIYLVFEYMKHDLAGLTSCPDIQFSESLVCLCQIFTFSQFFYVAFKVSFFWLSCQKWFPSSCSSKNFTCLFVTFAGKMLHAPVIIWTSTLPFTWYHAS